ncbi:tRNA pseudouridine38-40 synthase [Nematocida sp. LUAm3]|nr:tRNA pseudouridine38-40 synthase [Nematocida sp. LUAm3]KAI5174760.1 tRNA pseudouridine38-40 synthase [Nematocida sp. LUAm2]KAI5177829.1 tRNA pseudouridine38-40 synthase [Nematocida sp. LUAm1]
MGKKRVILIVGYNGEGYHGSQLNKEEETIEKRICDEISEAGYFNKRNCEDYSKTGLQRASRTDKGVHAASFVLSMKIETGEGKSISDLKKKLEVSLDPYNIQVHDLLETTKGFDAKKKCEARVYEYFVPRSAYIHPEDKQDIQEKRCKVFKEALSLMKGTHNYHNFTLTNQEKGTSRYIQNMVIEDLELDGTLWHKVSIHGQSFMIHQIRKMMGFAILLALHHTDYLISKEYIEKAFGKDRLNIPKSPSPLLLLSHGIFSIYNERHGESHGEITNEKGNEYKKKYLYPVVLTKEHENLFDEWKEVLEKHKEEFTYIL